MKIEAILNEQRDRILEIAVQHGARNVRVFGSVVRGEAQPNSDIDFLVDLGESLSPWFPVGLIQELEALLGHKVDVVTEKSLHYFIRDRILSEARSL
ncbi:MAG: nucleotidyltransferase family protein [Candidatus Parcubacteria bacterium]|nr:nucleotidyltransferase family protein [Leptolyngbyaceae cyanobacterium LF-bin-113]